MRLIGVTPARNRAEGKITVNQDYLASVERAGALPVVLPLTDREEMWAEMLRRVDGLLLTGGGDIDPALYGEEKLPPCDEPDPIRDRMELFLCRRALTLRLPILAICRGHQILNCALGGTLYQDMETQLRQALNHARSDIPRSPAHVVAVSRDSRLFAITGLPRFSVNSRHHQGIKTLGRGLTACAVAPDGVIEGVELPGEPFVLGVQWHPESLSDARPEAQALFNAFAEACGA